MVKIRFNQTFTFTFFFFFFNFHKLNNILLNNVFFVFVLLLDFTPQNHDLCRKKPQRKNNNQINEKHKFSENAIQFIYLFSEKKTPICFCVSKAFLKKIEIFLFFLYFKLLFF
jgi:hypothetical protein